MPHQIPHFALSPTLDRARVTGWGLAGGLLLIPGDTLLLADVWEDELLLLRPRGFGSVMLGRRSNNQLIAEPGSVPASPVRWSVIGGVAAVERPLPTNGTLSALSTGQWVLSPQTRALLLQTPSDADADADGDGDAAPATDWTQLDQLIRRLVLSPTPHGEGLVLGRSLRAAQALPPRPGWIRYVLLPPPAVVICGFPQLREDASTDLLSHAG